MSLSSGPSGNGGFARRFSARLVPGVRPPAKSWAGSRPRRGAHGVPIVPKPHAGSQRCSEESGGLLPVHPVIGSEA